MVISTLAIVITYVFVSLIVVTGNGVYLFNKFKAYVADISAKSFSDIFNQILDILPNKYKIYFLVQILIITVFFIVSLIKSKKYKKRPILNKKSFMHKNLKNEAQTDLDVLYNALLSKKQLGLEDIATMFKINRDVALEWCMTLENADLAVIDYPNFSRPILKLPPEEENIKEDEKEQRNLEKREKLKKIVHHKISTVKTKKTRLNKKPNKNIIKKGVVSNIKPKTASKKIAHKKKVTLKKLVPKKNVILKKPTLKKRVKNKSGVSRIKKTKRSDK